MDNQLKKLLEDVKEYTSKKGFNGRKFSLLPEEEKSILYNRTLKYVPWSREMKESYYCLVNGWFEKPKCPFCGETKAFNKGGYRNTCNEPSCVSEQISIKREQTLLEKYGVVNPGQLPSHREVVKKLHEANQKKRDAGEWVHWNKGLTKDTDERIVEYSKKISETKKERFQKGDIVIWNKGLTKEDSDSVKRVGDAVSERKKGKPLTENEYQHVLNMVGINKGVPHTEERKQKVKDTNLERYGIESYLSLVNEEGRKAIMDKYGVNGFSQTDQWKEMKEDILEKMKSTCLEKYGTEWAISNPDVKEKLNETKRKNNSFHSSKVEIEALKKLQEKFQVVFTQYSDDRYPFNCDFYIPSNDLFIECHFHWTHGDEPFDIENEEHLSILGDIVEKSNSSEYYLAAIDTWTRRDVEKRNVSEDSDINIKVFYSPSELDSWLSNIDVENNSLEEAPDNLEVSFHLDELLADTKYLMKPNFSYKENPSHNKPIIHFQSGFYEEEREMYQNEDIRKKLILNRCSYLHKLPSELTKYDLLKGFGISGKRKPYSHFATGWIKSFIQDWNPTTIYDPFGGWGHRLVGAHKRCNYIYNDLNTRTYEGSNSLYEFINEHFPSKYETKFYNEDASKFKINEEYDAVFTCPPYYNTEDYGVGTFESYEEFCNWILRAIELTIKPSVKTVGIVMSSRFKDLMLQIKDNFFEFVIEQPLGPMKQRSHLYTSENRETLYIFQ